MDERAALELLAGELSPVGDDAAIIDGLVITTDMLHETTDFPHGTTRYTAGWRAVGASLSDVAAMGAEAKAAVAVYAAPAFTAEELRDFVAGAREVCTAVGARYVGGDLDEHEEFTVASTAIGLAETTVGRDGATPGDRLCVTGTLGRTGAALRLFARDETAKANDLFCFEPRIQAGRALRPYATAMMDSSDGLARSLHQLATASECGFVVDSARLPIDQAVTQVASDAADRRELGVFVGEDFELIVTLPPDAVAPARAASPTTLSIIGEVTSDGIKMDDEPLLDRGYTHGDTSD